MKSDSEQGIVLGDVEVIRVVEWQGAFASALDVVPDSGTEVWKDNADWLSPDHWDPGTDRVTVALQTWVLRSAGRTILVDTGVGSMRERPGAPAFHHRQDDFLGALAHAGVRPQDVDLVVNTHVHADHVGGNTVDAAGSGSRPSPTPGTSSRRPTTSTSAPTTGTPGVCGRTTG